MRTRVSARMGGCTCAERTRARVRAGVCGRAHAQVCVCSEYFWIASGPRLYHVWVMIGIIFGLYLEHVCAMFGPCLDHVWTMFGPCLDHVWAMFGAYFVDVWIMFGACFWVVFGLCSNNCSAIFGPCFCHGWTMFGPGG
jgi:hypothetical protein